MAVYTRSSPWFRTKQNTDYLEILTIRPIPASPTDYSYVIETKFRYRPDLLAYSLYDDPKLWWVFAQRNIEILKDPIYDFEPGVIIKVPQRDSLTAILGS